MNNATLPPGIQSQIQAELQPGERIRWSAQPVVGAAPAKGTWLLFFFAIPWTAFAIFWTLGASGIILGGHGAPRAMGFVFGLFGLPFIAVGVWMLTTPWRARKKIAQMAGGTAYVITDRRAIIFDSGYATLGAAAGILAMAPKIPGMIGDSMRIQSFPPDKLQQLARVQHADGTGDILFSETSAPVYDHHHHHTHMVAQSIGFKGITQVQEVERLLKDLARGASPAPAAPSDASEPPVMQA